METKPTQWDLSPSLSYAKCLVKPHGAVTDCVGIFGISLLSISNNMIKKKTSTHLKNKPLIMSTKLILKVRKKLW